MSAERLGQLRKRQHDDAERKRIFEAEEQRRKDLAQAEDDARKLRGILLREVREVALELGFAWGCAVKTEPAGYNSATVYCMTSGTDRDEFTAHMRGHGAKSSNGAAFERVRLSRKVPKAKLHKPEINILKWLHWTQEHTPEATCRQCSHTINEHKHAGSTINGNTYDCRHCDCEHRYFGDFERHETQTAERRGQFLAEAGPHSVWVIPFEPAPWETGPHAAPVELHIIEPGRYSTHYSKYERREAQRRIKAQARHPA